MKKSVSLRRNARLDLCWRRTCLAIRPVSPARRFGRLRGLIFVRVAPTTYLDSFTYCELRSVAPVALAHQSLRVSQNDNVHDRGCRDDGRGGGRISHRSPHLRNGLVRPAFALHVMAGDMYRQRAADYRQRAAQEKDPSIKIAFEHEAAFWLGLGEQLDWNGRKEASPQITFSGLSL